MDYIANLSKYWFYHGTTLGNAKSIMKTGFNISNKIGSLGYGDYAFAESYDDARIFAKRTTNNKRNLLKINSIKPAVLKFKLKNSQHVLDFTRPQVILTFNKYTTCLAS